MSVEQFSRLSLEENMVATRAGAARVSRARTASLVHEQDTPLPSIEPVSPVSPVSPTPSLVISTNNLLYNVSAFDSNLRKRAKRGLEDNEIRMKYCATTVDEEDPGIKTQYFYIDDDITVAMGGKLRRPRCSCGANDNGIACKHIYWVGDQILSTTDSNRLRGQPLRLSSDGSTIQDVKPADILDNQGLEGIADDLEWVYRDEELPEDDEEMKETVINMLSVFEPHEALPHELRCPESPLTSERSKKFSQFTDLFTQYASRDPGLFLQMRDIIDPNFQSRVFFEKIDARITRTFNAMDRYIARGPVTNASAESPHYDIKTCAKKLRSLVKAIDNFTQEHCDWDEDGGADDADARDVAVRAAAALVRMLDLVMDRNFDAYEKIAWGMRPTSPGENNLFFALVQAREDGEPLFVLDALLALPFSDVLRNHWETLQGVRRCLVEFNAPAEYIGAFRRVVGDGRKRAASQVRGGEYKRSG